MSLGKEHLQFNESICFRLLIVVLVCPWSGLNPNRQIKLTPTADIHGLLNMCLSQSQYVSGGMERYRNMIGTL